MSENIKSLTVQTVVDTAIYASGDLIGTKMTFAGLAGLSRTLKVLSVLLVDEAKQSADIDLVLFSSDPTGTTFTNNAALDVADADMDKICGVITFRTADWFGFNDNSIGCKLSVNCAVQLSAGQ